MSGSIYVRALPDGKYVGGAGFFKTPLEAMFGTMPFTLTESDLPKLEAAHAFAEKNNASMLELLIAKINQFGEVEVYVEY